MPVARGVGLFAALLALATTLFLWFPGIDLWASALLYRPGTGFFLAQWEPVRAIYAMIPYGVGAIVIGVPVLLAFSLWRGHVLWRIDLRAAVFLLLALALGPGLLVNTILKDHWGRARPAQVAAFGGTQHFTPVFPPADQCMRNCSFPSGHAAVGFYFASFAFLIPQKRRRRAAAGMAMAAGALVGVARMAQGGHFLSDVVFAGFLVYATSWLLYRAILVHDPLRPLLRLSRLAWLAVGIVLAVALSMLFLDRPVALFFHDSDPTLHTIFVFITRFGLSDGYLIASALLFAGLRLLAWRVKDAAAARRLALHAYRALFVFVVVAASGLATDLIKVIFGRARPKLLFRDDVYGFVWGATQADYWSFPSGHATTIAALATAFFLLWPRGLPFYLLAALLVAASRVIIGAHYLSDIIFGGAVGVGTVWVVWIAFARAGLPLTGTTVQLRARRLDSVIDSP